MNKIFNENCLTGLAKLESGTVDCCVTSPPYFGLRDYGTDEQIGLEETPDAFVKSLVEVFREVKRVLKNDGTLWLNLGDSYFSDSKGSGGKSEKQDSNPGSFYVTKKFKRTNGLKPKDLIGIPWRVAFALQADGWYLRQDIIWHKPNPMPESVTDRCTKAHEYIFLLSKSARYYYDADAIKEETGREAGAPRIFGAKKQEGTLRQDIGREFVDDGTRNKRSVWTVTTKPYSGAHFATFPQDLIEPCIKAGCRPNGIVLDPFMGAGTTAIVARKLNRNYIGYELNPEYIKIAERRIVDELGMFA